jgi:hypothetical protein
MVSCPIHQEYLQIVFILHDKLFARNLVSKAPPSETLFLDTLTYQGLTTGLINFPNNETIHIAIWLRKLRGLFDELMCSSKILASSYKVIQFIREKLGRPFDTLRSSKLLFENLSDDNRHVIFQAAGIVVQDLLSGQQNTTWQKSSDSEDREILYPVIYNNDIDSHYKLLLKDRADVLGYWISFEANLQKPENLFWEEARQDQRLAFIIRQQLIKKKRSFKSIQAIDNDLKEIGIPIIKGFSPNH